MIEPDKRRVALLVAGCFFMEMLDATIVTTSAPAIARSLSVPTSSISIVITAYLVTVAALIPLSGWMSARWGERRVFLCAITTFTLASLGCALSKSLPELVAMRVLQGAGGAMMVPVGRLVVLARGSKVQLMTLTAYLIWPALVAPVIAPLLGGLITTYANWHWLFLLNVPVGIVAFGIAFRIVRAPPVVRPAPLDVAGVILTCAALVAITITAALLSQGSLDVPLVFGVAGVSAVVTTLAIRHLLTTNTPLIDLRTLRIHTLRVALGGSAIFFMAIGAVPFLVPLLFEESFGWSAVRSGALVLLIFVGNIAIKPATTFLYSRFGFRTILISATAMLAATLISIAFMTASTPIALIGLVLLLSGIARSVGGTGYTTIVFSEVSADEMRDANTLQATVQQLGLGFGVAAGAIALRLGHPLGEVLSSDADARAPYTIALVLVALLSLVATLGALRLRPGAGDVLRRESPRHARTPSQSPRTEFTNT